MRRIQCIWIPLEETELDGGPLFTVAWVLLSLFCATAAAPACFAADVDGDDAVSVKEIRKETRELLAALKTYTADHRDEAIERIKTAQNNLDQRTESLEREIAKDWNETDQAARDMSLATLQAPRQQPTEVAEHYASLKISSAAAWGHIKQGYSAAYDALYKSWGKAEQKFAPGD